MPTTEYEARLCALETAIALHRPVKDMDLVMKTAETMYKFLAAGKLNAAVATADVAVDETPK